MKNGRDILFKVGLGLQLLLIPTAFLWRFSSEANYFNWVLAGCLVVVAALSFWPQAVVVRLKRLAAIKLQFILVIVFLALSWAGWGYFYHYTRTNCDPAYPIVNGEGSSPLGPQEYGRNCNFDQSRTDISYSTVTYFFDTRAIFGKGLLMPLNPGISVATAAGLTLLFISLPAANLYRYQLDKKRVKGIKKEDLFV